MPKGETSRPNNRTERQAVRSRRAMNAGLRGKSRVNQQTIYSGPRNQQDQTTLANRDAKQRARERGAALERSTGRGLTNRTQFTRRSDGTYSSSRIRRR